MSEDAHLEIDRSGDLTIVRFKDDAIRGDDQIANLGKSIRRLISSEEQISLVFDFARVRFVNSAWLVELLIAKREITARKGNLFLCGIRPEIYCVFTEMHLDTLFEIVETEAEALESHAKMVAQSEDLPPSA